MTGKKLVQVTGNGKQSKQASVVGDRIATFMFRTARAHSCKAQ